MTEKTAMSHLEIAAAACLDACRFVPGSYVKRFARDVHRIAQSENPELTEKQRAYLWEQCWRYRRQIGAGQDGEEVVGGARQFMQHNAREGTLWVGVNSFPIRFYWMNSSDEANHETGTSAG